MRTLLVTGGAGFIGSHFIDYILNHYPEYFVVNIDNLSFAGNVENTQAFKDNPRYKFFEGDITDKDILDEIFAQFLITGIIHFAAESHVDRSITHPDAFIQSNILGTYTLLCCARENWQNNKKIQADPSMYRFHHISTDEVYGALGPDGSFTEQSPYLPNSPYSASKASSDLLVRSFHKTYGLNAVITHCSNNFGPHQHVEKLIPTVISRAIAGEKIPVYGEGKQVRDWLYVLDHCMAIDKVFHQARGFEHVNIGASQEYSNIELVKMICGLLDELEPKSKGSYKDQIKFVLDRPGHDFRYSVDTQKMQQTFGWQPQYPFEQALKDTIKWYLTKIPEKDLAS